MARVGVGAESETLAQLDLESKLLRIFGIVNQGFGAEVLQPGHVAGAGVGTEFVTIMKQESKFSWV